LDLNQTKLINFNNFAFSSLCFGVPRFLHKIFIEMLIWGHTKNLLLGA